MTYKFITYLKPSPIKHQLARSFTHYKNMAIAKPSGDVAATTKKWEDLLSFDSFEFDEPPRRVESDPDFSDMDFPEKEPVKNAPATPQKRQTTPVVVPLSSPSWAKFDDSDDILQAHTKYINSRMNIPSSPIEINPQFTSTFTEKRLPASPSKSSTEKGPPISPLKPLIEERLPTSPLKPHIEERLPTSPLKPLIEKRLPTSPLKAPSPYKMAKMMHEQTRQYSTKHEPSTDPDVEEVEILSKSSLASQPIKSLSKEQQYILDLVTRGVSLFYTGSAGTGKSFLLGEIIKTLRGQFAPGEVAVTASTGLAACTVGGVTLHSFAGIGVSLAKADVMVKKVRRNKKAYNRWQTVKVLIIDEISMIDGMLFDLLNELGQKLRKNKLPFGGIQVVVCGDFYQLPPVSKATNIDGTEKQERLEAPFAFESALWKEAIQTTLVLKEVFRQKGDQKFIDMLNELRSGYVSEESNREFKRLQRPLDTSDGIEPASLYPTRAEVEHANNYRLSKLGGDSFIYKAVDSGSLPFEQRQRVINNFLTPENLFLKKGAQVMCIKNFDSTLVNGSLGQVIGFLDRDTYMHYEAIEKFPTGSVEEIESIVAAEKKRKDSKIQEEMTAENKGKQLEDSIFDFMDDLASDETQLSPYSLAFKENASRKRDMLKQLHDSSKGARYPLVKFLLQDKTHRVVLVEPESWTVEDENMNVLAKRVQIPLILAWSLSIHKSQGQTLPKAKIDLRRIFENGQAYVALSRATSRAGLQVLNFDRSKVKAHTKVNAFYASLSSADEARKQLGGGQLRLHFKKAVSTS